MADHKHTRPWFEVLRRMGSVGPVDLPLRTPAQAVAILDNYTKNVPPILIPSYATDQYIVNAVNQVTAAELESKGRGLVVTGICCSEAAYYKLFTTLAPSGLANTINPTYLTGSAWHDARPAQAVFNWGTRVPIAPAQAQYRMHLWTLQQTLHEPIYIAPGVVLNLEQTALNTPGMNGFTWYEIPAYG